MLLIERRQTFAVLIQFAWRPADWQNGSSIGGWTRGRVLAPNLRYQQSVPPDVCCTRMAAALSQACPEHNDPFECPDNLFCWCPPLDEYGLVIHDGGASYVFVSTCPWCGRRLPDSKRERWLRNWRNSALVVVWQTNCRLLSTRTNGIGTLAPTGRRTNSLAFHWHRGGLPEGQKLEPSRPSLKAMAGTGLASLPSDVTLAATLMVDSFLQTYPGRGAASPKSGIYPGGGGPFVTAITTTSLTFVPSN